MIYKIYCNLLGEKFRYGQTFGHSTENALKYKRPAVAK